MACCVAASMMLGAASPAMVGATAQDEFSFNENTDAESESVPDDIVDLEIQDNEELPDTEDDTIEISDADVLKDYRSNSLSDQNITADADMFSSGEENISDESDSDVSEAWTPLTRFSNETRILYKYDENEKTLYFKCTEPVAMPNFNYGNRTDWFVDLGSEKIAQIKKIVIGEGITQIGDFCFQSKTADDTYASLEEVELASTVTVINRGAFGDDIALKNINLNNVTSIGQASFADCAIENIVFEVPEVEIGMNAFYNCPLLQSVNAKKIISLGESAFQECSSLKSFSYEGGIESIPRKAFYKTALETFDFRNVKAIASMAFRKCGLKAGCYAGTREEWSSIVGTNKDFTNVVIHCKGEAVEPKSATCEAEGLKSVGTCEVCGEEYSYNDEANKLPALGHEYADTYTEDRPATCTESGEESKHCTREGCDSRTDVKELSALGHDFVSKVTKKATCTTDGALTYTCSRCNETKTETIKATGHMWSSWKRTGAATVFKPEVQTRKCSACNKSETRNIGKKLAPKATLNASTVTLKVKQSTSRLKVTGLAKGDSVKSWKSSNSKIFTVRGKSNGTCKITGKKRGTAKLQITLASGLKKTVKVKVQTVAVKTSKITVSKNVTVQKGKRVTLKPVVTPFTSSQKVTYTSSNKKIATVSSKGVVTGKKKGTVKITVKSGSKSVKVTVKVK